MPYYYCSCCKLAVLVIDGQLIRACTCDAAVVADMVASLAGAGGMKQG